MSDHGHEHQRHEHEHRSRRRGPDDLNLIDRAEEDLPIDPSPEATADADLTEHGIDEDTSGEVVLEPDDDRPPGARARDDHGGSP